MTGQGVEERSWHATGGWKGKGEEREQPLAPASERTGVTSRKLYKLI